MISTQFRRPDELHGRAEESAKRAPSLLARVALRFQVLPAEGARLRQPTSASPPRPWTQIRTVRSGVRCPTTEVFANREGETDW